MVQPDFLSLGRLKMVWFSVLLSNPLRKDEIRFIQITPWFRLTFYLRRGFQSDAKDSIKQHYPLLACIDQHLPLRACVVDAGVVLPLQSSLLF
jgi:hypothetical protein